MEEELYEVEVLESTTEPTTAEIADALASRVSRGKQILDACEGQLLDALKVEGKTLREWGLELNVVMPREDHNDILEMERASTDLSEAIQKAERIYGIFEFQAAVSTHSHEEEFARRYVEEMNSRGGRKIAAEKLKQLVMVDKKVDATLAATQAAKVITGYFKRIINGLTEARKGLENRARLAGLRMKFLEGHY